MELTRRRNRFASGKPNALVVDIGANTTSVTPISDGFVLKKGASLPATASFNLNPTIAGLTCL